MTRITRTDTPALATIALLDSPATVIWKEETARRGVRKYVNVIRFSSPTAHG